MVEKIYKQPIDSYEQPKIDQIDFGDSYIEEFEKDLLKKKQIVKRVLTQSNPATNNDFILQLLCLKAEFKSIDLRATRDNIILTIPKYQLKRISSPESYTRVRRTLNKQGIGLPSDERVSERRGLKQKAIKKYYAQNK